MIFYGQKKNLNYIIFVPKIQLFQSFGVFNSVIVLIIFLPKQTQICRRPCFRVIIHCLHFGTKESNQWDQSLSIGVSTSNAYILARIGRYENRRAREYPPMSYFYISIFYKLCLEKQTLFFLFFLIPTPGALFMKHEQHIQAYEQ